MASAAVAGLVTAIVVLGAFGAYAAAIAIAGALVGARPGSDGRRGEPLRMAALVVAHDEERVIESSVASLVRQQYPEDELVVFVVADRCTDRTAERAAAAGARVLTRDEGPAGKSGAVAFGVGRIAEEGGFDGVCIFDSDNVADSDFVSAVARRLANGERAVQGLVDAKNPEASWVAAASALGFWAIAGVVQAPRERLGLSTPPMGTGFCMSMADAARFLSRTDSLTDDIELSAVLALEGIRVAYEPRARLVDEKPTTLRTAISQRHRWMQGRFAVGGKYAPRLIRRALAGGGPRFALVDAAIQLFSPSIFFVAVSLAVLGALAATLPSARVPVHGVLAFAAVLFLLPAPSLARFRPPPFVWLCYLAQPAYLVLSAPLALSGFLTRRSRTWRRTPKG